ncbi:MAG: hypothetical protein RR552_05065 [Oscillospiraceae bacterium]
MNKFSMPLLEKLIADNTKQNDTVVLHINHCMNNSFYFTEQLKKVFHEVVFVAVPYNDKNIQSDAKFTTYHAVHEGKNYILKRNNVMVETKECDFLSATKSLISLALENELLEYVKSGKKLLIIEDGGYHYDMINALIKKHPIFKKAIIGAVEQTTAGTRSSYLQNDLCYPVASVARSYYKVRVEAYFVANRVVDELKRMMHEINEFIDFHSILLIGYGIIGRSIALCLKQQNIKIYVYDTDEAIQNAAIKDGFYSWDGTFEENMIVIGNVGQPSFTKEMLNSYLSGSSNRIFLASSSSKQVEFEAVFNKLDKCKKETVQSSECFHFTNGKSVVLLAQGYPLNFYDENADSLTYDMIDPVFSEIFLLAIYLVQNYQTMNNKTYLLGSDENLNNNINENQLLLEWMQKNGLYFNMNTFNVHPEENKLMEITF